MVETRRWELWGNLQGKKIHFPHFLSAVTIDGLRGSALFESRWTIP